MKYVSQKQGLLIFLGFDIILLLVFLVAMLPLVRQKNAPDMQESALLNPKYAGQVRTITLSVQDDGADLFHRHVLTLVNSDGWWMGGDSLSDTLVWPADNQSVQNLIALSSTVATMYKRADRVTSWKEFGLDDDDALCLTFYGEADTVLSQLYFGREDTLTQRVAMRTGARGTVWDVPSSILTYLTMNQSFWADPYILPRVVTGLSESESSSSLRRGLVQSSLPEGESTHSLQKDFGDGTSLRLSFHEQDDGSYLVSAAGIAGPAVSAQRRRAIETMRYSYAISAWTYGRLLSED